eukprot:3947086-Pyramimonas_sp.AAC.1
MAGGHVKTEERGERNRWRLGHISQFRLAVPRTSARPLPSCRAEWWAGVGCGGVRGSRVAGPGSWGLLWCT